MFDRERNDRLLRLGGYPAERVFASTAFVGGVGATGNEVAKNLALLGVGTLVLSDLDLVEKSNLSRSVLFRESDVGRPKVEAASERLREINPSLRVVALHGNVGDVGLGVLRRCDLIFSCYDQRYPRFVLNEAAVRLGSLWVDSGLGETNHRYGRIAVYDGADEKSRCYACGLSAEDYQALMGQYRGQQSCRQVLGELGERGIVPTISTLASIIAGAQVQLGLECLGDDGRERSTLGGRTYQIHFNTRRTNFGRSRPFRRCPIHAHWSELSFEGQRIVELPEARSDTMTLGELLSIAGRAWPRSRPYTLLHEPILTEGRCASCEARWPLFATHATLEARRRRDELACPSCAQPGGFVPDPVEGEVTAFEADSPFASRTLEECGLRRGDILTIVLEDDDDDRVMLVELTGDLVELGLEDPAAEEALS